MTVLTDEATAQYAARKAAQEAALDEARKVFRQAALDAIRGVLVREDGTALTLSEAGLSPVHVDQAAGLVVAGDGVLYLAAQQREEKWAVRVVVNADGGWTPVSERVRSLADIGEAIA